MSIIRMHKNLIIALLTLALTLALTAEFYGTGRATSENELDIKDIVVCNVYWEDYELVNLPKPDISKFVITFNTYGPVDLGSMESIHVTGPNGYAYKIALQHYNNRNLNGFIRTGESGWFMAFDERGFLKDGRYTITLTYKSGKVTQKSRVLKYSSEILDTFLATKMSHSPTGRLSPTAPLNEVILKWTVLKGIDAYYMTRLGTNRGPDGKRTRSHWIFEDTIFGYGTGNPRNTGLNKGSLHMKKSLKADTPYYWFAEILDSNDFNKINIAIFLHTQHFRTGQK